jgi:hypothetical protein
MAITQLTYPHQEPELTGEDTRLRNWARNSRLGLPGSVVAPATEAELCDFLSTSDGRVRMIGSRMSPGRMIEVADGAGTLLDLSRLSGLISSTEDTATFAGSTSLAEVYAFLTARGQMLDASPGVIAEQTLAGALSTGTHGQGLQQSSIAGAALAIRMVLADGTVAEYAQDHPDFPAVQLGLGSLGVITAVTLRARESMIYTCVKKAVDAGTLETDLETWNRENLLVKAWWFPQENQVQVWTANKASDDEVSRYRAGGSQLVEYATTDTSMNSTIESTLQHLPTTARASPTTASRSARCRASGTSPTSPVTSTRWSARGSRPPDQRGDRHPARAGRGGDQEDQGLARGDPASHALPGDPALHRRVGRVVEPVERRGHLLLRLRGVLLGRRFAVRGG